MATDYRSLFIGDLSVYCTERDVQECFQPFGPIEAIKLKRGSIDRNHLSYGFVRFLYPESAQAALENLQGSVFLGRPIKIGWAKPGIGKKFQPKSPMDNLKTAQIHVSFISKQVDALVSEATLRSLFTTYGIVADVTIKKSQFDQVLRIQNGYGFIHYPMTMEGISSAIQATHCVHQLTVDRVTYDCSLTHALEQVVKSDSCLLSLWQHPPASFFSADPHRQVTLQQQQQQQQQQQLQLMMLGGENDSTVPRPPPLPTVHLEHGIGGAVVGRNNSHHANTTPLVADSMSTMHDLSLSMSAVSLSSTAAAAVTPGTTSVSSSIFQRETSSDGVLEIISAPPSIRMESTGGSSSMKFVPGGGSLTPSASSGMTTSGYSSASASSRFLPVGTGENNTSFYREQQQQSLQPAYAHSSFHSTSQVSLPSLDSTLTGSSPRNPAVYSPYFMNAGAGSNNNLLQHHHSLSNNIASTSLKASNNININNNNEAYFSTVASTIPLTTTTTLDPVCSSPSSANNNNNLSARFY